MSKAPAMPMYWDAYLADTTHLTTEEHGAYMLLLAAMWRRNGSVPDDDRDNARMLGLTPAKWRKTKARFAATIYGFIVENGAITQEKLQKTWKNTQEKIEKNKLNGAKGGRAASNKSNNLAEANATNSPERNATIPEPEPEPYKKEDTKVSLSIVSSEPDLFDEFWERYPRKVAKPNAKRAYAKALKKHSHDDVMFGLSQHLPSLEGKETQFIPHAATWLNGERFNDQPEQPANNTRQQRSGSRANGQRVDASLANAANLFGIE